MTSADPPSAPAFAGKYRLVRMLGKGAMGEVWLAVEEGPRNFRRQVAVKRLLATSDLSDYARESFVAEAQVIARLDHPNIVRLVELGETAEDHSLYLVLDYVDGAALDRLIKKGGPLSPAAVALLGREVARALDAVHSMADEQGKSYGVVHRDVSPGNILISRDGRVRLSDFGVARISGFGGEKTETGVFKGKLPYMPPEQAAGQAFDGRADCFSLGVTLFEALIGGRLRKAETQGQLIAMIATEQAPRVREREPNAPEHLAYAIDVATVFDPAERVRSAGELAALLDDALRALGPRAEHEAIAELRERTAAAGDAGPPASARAPWSMAISGSQPSAAAADRPTTGSSTEPHRPRHSVEGPAPPLGASAGPASVPDPDVPTAISSSGPHATAGGVRAAPPSVPSGAFTSAGSMAGPLAAGAAPTGKRRVVVGAALAAIGSAIAVAAAMFFLGRGGTAPPGEGARSAASAIASTPRSLEDGAVAVREVTTAEPVVSASDAEEPLPEATTSAVRGRPGPPPRPRAPTTASAAAPAADDGAPGSLQVVVVPWGSVVVDGKPHGNTPIGPISLAPGTHTVSVTNSDLGAQRSATVKIVSGKSHAVKFDLKKD